MKRLKNFTHLPKRKTKNDNEKNIFGICEKKRRRHQIKSKKDVCENLSFNNPDMVIER